MDRPMGDRLSEFQTRLLRARTGLMQLWTVSPPLVLGLATSSGVLLTFLLIFAVRGDGRGAATSPAITPPAPTAALPQLGPRHQLNYQQWVDLLAQEASIVAEQRPEQLTVLLGDSISLWFPHELLPGDRHWLNQGISGETAEGLLYRLHLLDATEPRTILLMIGINDLLRGIDDVTLMGQYQQIIHYLRHTHPNTQIVVQSILPHADERATWEGRDRLLSVPNSRIENLNQQLGAIAAAEGVYFLNLYPLFTDETGNLDPQLSTDGLHLNQQGYLVWRTGLHVYIQQVLEAKG
ncbi:MAG: lysophospholipase [Kaiparowitsia implicata GSE-PSE-MK54-09C]|nr:lysophospholipase [Kaiparowitsia implicata GSE-PSE-MK54-09C]